LRLTVLGRFNSFNKLLNEELICNIGYFAPKHAKDFYT